MFLMKVIKVDHIVFLHVRNFSYYGTFVCLLINTRDLAYQFLISSTISGIFNTWYIFIIKTNSPLAFT